MRHCHPFARALAPALVAALALLVLAGGSFLPGCAQKPDSPVWSNPLDPANGDPFDLRVHLSGQTVVVQWDKPAFPDIAAFEVMRSVDGLTFAKVGETPPSLTTYLDATFTPNVTNSYKVRVRNTAGGVSGISRQASVPVTTPPYLRIAGRAQSTPTRNVTLSIVTAAGDSLEIAATADFAGATRLAADTSDTNRVPWDLGPAAANGLRRHVWLRVKSGALFSLSAHDSIEVSFKPDLQIALRPATLASRRLTIDVTAGDGLDRMRFAPTRADLATASWVTPDSVVAGQAWYTGTLLGPDTAAQWLFGDFECDFGFAFVDSLLCTPDNLASALFTLARNANTTTTRTVKLGSSAVATQMRFHENPDSLAAAPWQAYADTVLFTLSPVASGQSTLKEVYGQYANDWFSKVASDTIRLIPPPARARPVR